MLTYDRNALKEQIAKLVLEGYGHEVIAYHLNQPLRRVIEIVRDLPFSPPLNPKFLPIEEEAVIKLYRLGKSVDEIAKKFKRTPDAIDSFLRRKKLLGPNCN